MTDSASPEKPGDKHWAWRLLPLAILVAAIGAIFASGLTDYLNLEAIAENRARLAELVERNYVLSLLLFLAAYALAVAMSVPGAALMTITGGFLFGAVAGGLTTITGATLGATLLFLIARSSLGEPLARRAGDTLVKLREGFRKDAFNYLLFLRLVPAFPFWLVNLAPAFLGVPLRIYVTATFIGIIPGTFAFAYFGVGLDSVITRQQQVYDDCLAKTGAATGSAANGGAECVFELSFSEILTPQLLGAFTILGLVALIPVIVRRVRESRGGGGQKV